MPIAIGADTNIVFSGLYFGGKAAPLIKAVRHGRASLFQSEYLRDELVGVAKRNGMPLKVIQLFYSLPNVHVIRDASYYSVTEFENARKLVRDGKDLPVFVFAKKMLLAGKIDRFVSGDSDLLTPRVKEALSGKMVSLVELNELLT